jgi:hypothetical protein
MYVTVHAVRPLIFSVLKSESINVVAAPSHAQFARGAIKWAYKHEPLHPGYRSARARAW